MLLDVRLATTVAAPQADVFGYLADGERLPDWMTEFEAVRQTTAGPPAHGTVYQARLRRGWASTFEWSEFEPASRLAWRARRFEAGPGSVTPDGRFELAPAGDGTLVTVALRPELGGLLTVMAPLLEQKIRERGAGVMERLATVLEGRAEAAAA